MSFPIGDLIYTLPKDLFDRIQALSQERDRLRAALEKYGVHSEWCATSNPDNPTRPCPYPTWCTCGLDKALKGSG